MGNTRSTIKEIYLPVPIWMGDHWEGRDKRETGCPIMSWPDGFDPNTIPVPDYKLHEWVEFNFGPEKMIGEIIEIERQGGKVIIKNYPQSESDGRVWGNFDSALSACEMNYIKGEIRYTIFANGHNRWVRGKYIIGKSEKPQKEYRPYGR